MKNRMSEMSPERHARDFPSPARTTSEATGSVRRAGVIAGAALLLMSALAGFGALVVVDGLVTQGDAAGTAGDILASEGMFRFGVASLFLVVVLDVVVAWALLRFFSPVSRSLSRLAAWLRLAYAAVFMVAIGQLAGIPQLLKGDGYSAAFSTEQLQAQALLKADAYYDIWFAALILFGGHLVLIGYLAYRSGYVPRLFGVLLVIAGAGYAFDSFGRVLSEGSPVISTVTFPGEFLLALWLVVRARRVSLGADAHAN
jgi:hypothetical protein